MASLEAGECRAVPTAEDDLLRVSPTLVYGDPSIDVGKLDLLRAFSDARTRTGCRCNLLIRIMGHCGGAQGTTSLAIPPFAAAVLTLNTTR